MTERAAAIPALVEAFREHGYEGASPATLCAATGLGKGSLYNFFPGGKEEMDRRACLQGAFAPGGERDLFAATINRYFDRWVDSLAAALHIVGMSEETARLAAAAREATPPGQERYRESLSPSCVAAKPSDS